MAGASQGRNSNFDSQNQRDRSDYIPLDETEEQSLDPNRAASSASRKDHYPQLCTESTSESSRGSTDDFRRLEASGAKNVTIPPYILIILVVVVIVTFMVCVTLLMIILLTMMPQNISDAAKEGKVFIYVKRSSPVEQAIGYIYRVRLATLISKINF